MTTRTHNPSTAALDLTDRIRGEGLVDTHFHVGPELIPRRYDVAELAKVAKTWNATLVLKNHTYPTTPLAAYARHHEGVRLLGGTVLNRYVGGLNADAVASADSGNRTNPREEQDEPPFVVWMPTVHAKAHLDTLGHAFDKRWGGCSACDSASEAEADEDEEPVHVFADDGSPLPELEGVLEAIASTGARLATGHLSAAEIMQLVPMALEAGIPAVLLTHPHYPSINLSDEQLVELTRDDRVFIEHCLAIHTIEEVPLEKFVDSMRATGTDQVILSTDFGQIQSEPFPDGTIRFAKAIEALWPAGWDESELVALFTEHPRRALGLVR